MVAEANLSLSTDGRIIRFGNSLEELLGYSADDVRSMDFADLLPGEDMEGSIALLAMVREKGRVTGRKTAIRRKDGSIVEIYLSIHSLRDLTGEINSFMVLLNTGRSAQTPVILSDEFQRMFRFSSDAVAVTGKDGCIIDVNRAFLDTYGYERAEVLGKNPSVLKSPHSTRELYEQMWKDILDADKGFWRGEILNLRKDGTEVPVLLSINAITDGNGEIKNFLGIAFNMAGQKEMERTRKMYVDYIVHDMRGPLTTIMTGAELLSMQLGEAGGESAQKKLDAILDSTVRLSNMAKDMLDYSRACSGKLGTDIQTCDLADVLKTAVLPFESSTKKLLLNGVEFKNADIERREIKADAEKLQRIVYNLVSNGLKYASEKVCISYEFTGTGLLFIVSNDGRPISVAEAERVFDPFYQTEDGIKVGGVGLGLSIVKEFVEAHGGKVWMEPGKDCGVAFCLTIPT